MSIKNKLNRLKSHLSNEKDRLKQEEPVRNPIIKKDEIPFMDVWKQSGVVPYYTDNDYCLVREVSYPLDTMHGKYYFADFLKAVDAWNNSERNHPLSASGHHPEDLFFFDTETTGLGGGTGNTIFL